MKKVAVIGAGPSGLMSIFALLEENSDVEITLFESSNEIGKRIKVSGNGRCNFFHLPIEYDKYSSPSYAKKYMELFLSKYQEIFDKLGFIYYHDEEGRCYPLSESSKTIIHLFTTFLEKKKVKVLLNTPVTKLISKDNHVELTYLDKKELFDDVILSVGGFSYLYDENAKREFFINNNIKLTKLSPSLTPIKTNKYLNKNLEGKRFKVCLSLTYKNQEVFKENGEILFKKDGISGIVTFNLSSYLARKHLTNYNDYLIHIDFAPNLDKEQLNQILYNTNFSLEDNLNRLFIKELKDELILTKAKDIIELIKNYKLTIIQLYPFASSQVTSGGIPLESIKDFALKDSPHIYPCGEILDIDGVCGGYNIAFCFASGYIVGKQITKV